MKRYIILLLLGACFNQVIAQSKKLAKKERTAIVQSIASQLESHYIDLDTAKKMNRYIEAQLRKGAYDTIGTPDVFAARLTSDLLSVYHDGHLSIDYNPGFVASSGRVDTAAQNQRFRHAQKVHNFGFEKAEILPGNIGYLEIRAFFPPDEAGKAMVMAAFHFVSNADALIVDLRENHGGDPTMVSYICGLFFAGKTHLNDLYTRNSHKLETFWTVPSAELPVFQHMPLYILTSKQTFSAGEEFSYDMKTQKRATLIGEATGGGAHLVQPIPVADGFVANIPFARAISPITKTDWESTGVQPDIAVRADRALETAIQLAAENR